MDVETRKQIKLPLLIVEYLSKIVNAYGLSVCIEFQLEKNNAIQPLTILFLAS